MLTAGDVLNGGSKTELDSLQKSIAQLQRALAETFRYVDEVVVRSCLLVMPGRSACCSLSTHFNMLTFNILQPACRRVSSQVEMVPGVATLL